MLYWFRTPPDVKVGRSPFDPATQRALEAQNPDVKFNWPQIVAAKIPPPTPVENWRERRRAERVAKQARSIEAAEVSEARAVEAVDVAELAELTEVSGLAEPLERGEGGSFSLPPGPASEGSTTGSGPPKGGPQVTSGGLHATTGRRRRRRGGRRGRQPRTGAGAIVDIGATATIETGAAAPGENGDLDQPNPPVESSKEE